MNTEPRRRRRRREPLEPLDSYNAAVQLYNQEFRTLGERTMAFLIVQSILVAAFVTVLTLPAQTMRETLPYGFYPILIGIIVVGVLYCLLHHSAGSFGSRAAFRWKQYMRHVESNDLETPWDWFYEHSPHTCRGKGIIRFLTQSQCERCLLEKPPLPSTWFFSPAIFLTVWAFAIIYIFLRHMGGRVPLLCPLTVGVSVFILVLASFIMWRWASPWRTGNLV